MTGDYVIKIINCLVAKLVNKPKIIAFRASHLTVF
jgi:hypothetical protein